MGATKSNAFRVWTKNGNDQVTGKGSGNAQTTLPRGTMVPQCHLIADMLRMSVPAFSGKKKSNILQEAGSTDFHRKAFSFKMWKLFQKPCNTRGFRTNKTVCRPNASHELLICAYLIRRSPRILPALSFCVSRLWVSMIFKGINRINCLG